MNIQLILLVSLALVSIASSMVIMKPRPDENDDLLKKSVAVEEDARVPENSEEADDAEPEEGNIPEYLTFR
ncbi:hypothetical protein AC249_AIPGENE4665 [Exaiptasia diaphana]|nr:hypothetical protein AC249_AIPGENE4665 [Exaiptasia diaphana]